MRYLTLAEVLELHRRIMAEAGTSSAIRDIGGLSSAVAQPQATFEAVDLHVTLAQKAAALCFSIISNHPFLDGNKRVGHAAMEAFLMLNGCEMRAAIDDSERVILQVASGQLGREDLAAWIQAHVVKS